MAEVSIIVPVYQVEKYIRQCIDSILAQTFTDFELILVDDGSTDQSGIICDEYAKQDKRIQVIHKENSGASDTRNRGIDSANGNYLMFIDSDDYILPNMLECLYKNIINVRADISACNFLYFFENKRDKDFSTDFKSELLSGKDIFYFKKNERNFGYWTVVWNKLYKKEVFENIRFRTGKYYEDEFLANDIYQKDIKILTIPECLYYYRQHDNNTMKNKNIIRSFDIIEAFQERINIYLKNSKYANEAFKVFIYSLEHLQESKELISNNDEKRCFIKVEKKTKDIIKKLKKSQLSTIKKLSLIFIEMNPCFVFSIGMKMRGLLEKFL